MTASLTKVTALARFQGDVLLVLELTTGPNTLAPAFATSLTCSWGHRPADIWLLLLQFAVHPRTISPAIPASMYILGNCFLRASMAFRVAYLSPSPAAAVVSKLAPSEPEAIIFCRTNDVPGQVFSGLLGGFLGFLVLNAFIRSPGFSNGPSGV